MTHHNQENSSLLGSDPESLTRDCAYMRETVRLSEPLTADEVLDFLDGYNAFINHATRAFTPMREVNMLL